MSRRWIWIVFGFVLGWAACDGGSSGKNTGETPTEQGGQEVGVTEQEEPSSPSEPAGTPDTSAPDVRENGSPEPAVTEPTNDAGPTENVATPEAKAPDLGFGEPIQAPDKKWHWVDVPGSRCGYGSETGFAINVNPGAKRLLIYFQGGGACWKEKAGIGSCYDGVPTSFNLTGFDKKTFEQDLVTRQNLGSPIFDRNDGDNVFHDAHMVFLPYCTGDVFSGQRVVNFAANRTMHFVGHQNLKAFLARIVPTVKGVDQVVISGSSAGGFGSALNWWAVQKYFGDQIPVHLLDDSGPPIEPADGRWDEWIQTWDMALPADCADCKKSVKVLMQYYQTNLLAKGRRMGFLTYDRDAVIRNFFGISNLFGQEFKQRVDALFDEMDKIPNANYFALAGSSHTLLLFTPKLLRSKDGVSLMRWIEWMVEGNSSWKSHRP